MKLTIEQLSKLTKLSIPTLRVYVSRQKLGTKVGNKRVFSQSDVQKLLKTSKRLPTEKKAKSPAKRARAGKKAIKPEPTKSSAARPKADEKKPSALDVKSKNPSLWTRLFGVRKQKEKIGLLDAKTTK